MATETEIPRAYTIRDFCRAFGVGRTLVYEQIATGNLKAKKLGKRTLILAEDAENWATALPSMNGAQSNA